jgi:hypothetical protein
MQVRAYTDGAPNEGPLRDEGTFLQAATESRQHDIELVSVFTFAFQLNTRIHW